MFESEKCQPDVAAVVAAVTSLCSSEAGFQPNADGEIALNDVRALLVMRKQLDAHLGQRLIDMKRRELTKLEGFQSLGSWAAGEMLMEPGEVTGLVRAAAQCRAYPKVGELVESGRLSASHIRATAAALAGVPARMQEEGEEFLAREGHNLTPREFRAIAQELRETLVPELVADELDNLRESDELTLSPVAGGLRVRALLHGQAAEEFRSAIDRFSKPTIDDYRDARKRRADGLALMARIAATADLKAHDLSDTGYEPEDLPAVSTQIICDVITMQRALDRIHARSAAQTFACFESSLQPGYVPTSRSDLVRGAYGERTGAPIDWRSLVMALTSGQLQRLVLEARTEVLDLGRDYRLASRAQRRALKSVHGHCLWPGCDSPWVEIDHIEPWLAGGPTDLKNLRPLCRFHHTLVTMGWTLVEEPDPEAPDLRPRLQAVRPLDWTLHLAQTRRRRRREPRVA